jgi:6-phospho-3-hexuloisomerase/3-hexulose-6-phosphate synthase/6-phospho-3-hexuloisomerase
MHQQLIIDKISGILAATDDGYDAKLIALVDGAKRIFVAGAGRSGLISKFFAMRLMHAGHEVYVVGEIVTPSIREGDLFLVISGSGETETMLAFTKSAKKQGAKIALISTKETSTIGDLADAIFQIGKPELYVKVVGMPMGTVFELSTLFFLEATISHVIHEKGIPEEEMRTRHANLE